MYVKERNSQFDYYAVTLSLESHQISYHFQIEKRGELICYNRQGVVDEINPYFDFCIIPGFHTPAWAKGAVCTRSL